MFRALHRLALRPPRDHRFDYPSLVRRSIHRAQQSPGHECLSQGAASHSLLSE